MQRFCVYIWRPIFWTHYTKNSTEIMGYIVKSSERETLKTRQ